MSVGRIVLFLFLWINAVQDLRKKEILLIPSLIYAFISLWGCLVTEEDPTAVLFCCLPGLLFFVLALVTSGKVGLGDAWILLVLGLQLGLMAAVEILWAALLEMTGYAMISALIRRGAGRTDRRRKTVLPMVPFLFLAAVLWQRLGG